LVQDVGRDQLSLENNGGSFSALAALLDVTLDVSAVNVVVPENESVAVFTLDATLFGSAALTAGMNAVVIISTAMRREKALSIHFILIVHHPSNRRHNEQILKYKENQHVLPTGCCDVHPAVEGRVGTTQLISP